MVTHAIPPLKIPENLLNELRKVVFLAEGEAAMEADEKFNFGSGDEEFDLESGDER